MSIRRLLLAGLTVAAVLTTACQPALPPPAPSPPPVQVEGTTLVEGDSITVQWAIGGGSISGAEVHSGLGWTATVCHGAGCVPAAKNVPARVTAQRVDRLMWSLGSNDAALDGWTVHDELFWHGTFMSLPASTCLALIEPYHATNPGIQAEFVKAGVFMAELAETRPNTTFVRWIDWAAAPGVLDPDGLHLAAGRVPVDARTAAMTAALSGCD